MESFIGNTLIQTDFAYFSCLIQMRKSTLIDCKNEMHSHDFTPHILGN